MTERRYFVPVRDFDGSTTVRWPLFIHDGVETSVYDNDGECQGKSTHLFKLVLAGIQSGKLVEITAEEASAVLAVRDGDEPATAGDAW